MNKYFIIVIITQLILCVKISSSIRNLKDVERIKYRFQQPHRIKSDQIIDADSNIWNELDYITIKYQPVDLSMGFPNVPISKLLSKSMSNVVQNETALFNQYTTSEKGNLRLRRALSQFYSPLIHRMLSVENEILITSGGTSALNIAIQSHIDDGDEVILIEPYYSPYKQMVQYYGGVPRYVSLRPTSASKLEQISSSGDWKLNFTEFEQAFNSKTKMLLLNNPINPLGKMYTREELENIALLCQRWNILVLADEVYSFLPLNGRKHIRFSTLPGMWDRTITIGSASKTFSVTGWRIGWAYGPSYLLESMIKIQHVTLFRVSTPAQEALAIGFENEMLTWGTSQSYLSNIPLEIQEKVNYFVNVLYKNGWKVIIPEAGYLIVADWSSLENKIDLSQETGKRLDYKFLKWFARNVGIRAQKLTFTKPNLYLGEHLFRLCVFKTTETLNAAAFRISRVN